MAFPVISAYRTTPIALLKAIRWKLVADPLWTASLCAVALFYVVHIAGLLILVTYDGRGYIGLAEVLGTSRFATEWDFLRGPLYPLVLKVSFWLFGLRPAAIVIPQAAAAFAGIWLIGDALRKLGRRLAAPIVVLLLGAFPTLVAFEHIVLTEAGSFFFLALLVRLVAAPARRPLVRAVWLTVALALAYYYRASFIWLAPVAAAIFCLSALRPAHWKTLVPAATAVALGPFLLAWPWARNPEVSRRTGASVLLYGLAKQAVIPRNSPLLGPPRLPTSER